MSSAGRVIQGRKRPMSEARTSDHPTVVPMGRRGAPQGRQPQGRRPPITSASSSASVSRSHPSITSSAAVPSSSAVVSGVPSSTAAPRLNFSPVLGMKSSSLSDLQIRLNTWVFEVLGGKSGVELECKWGRILSVSNNRMRLSETPTMKLGTRTTIEDMRTMGAVFDASITKECFQMVNSQMTEWYNQNQGRMKAMKLNLLDKAYESKTRVSLDADHPGKVFECIKKDRLGDLNILCPRDKFDLRVSASLENKVPLPDEMTDKLRSIRLKKRISFIMDDLFRIDLTIVSRYLRDDCPFSLNDGDFLAQCMDYLSDVTNSSPLPFIEKVNMSYEMEMELYNNEVLRKSRAVQQSLKLQRKLEPGVTNDFPHICIAFLQNCLSLQRFLKYAKPKQ